MDIKHFSRGFSLAAILLAGSCTAHINNGNDISADGAVNHPIAVEPAYQSLKLTYVPAESGISSADEARFNDFVMAYESRGSGSIAVSAPAGINSKAMSEFFAQRINDMGVSKDRILVATHDAPGSDQRVEINYVSYRAHTEKCGDWSENLTFTADNLLPKNFGCSIQQNIAAQIADPRDLNSPRNMTQANANRRAAVISNYEQGKPTAATKRTTDMGVEQSAPGSAIAR